jgi:RNA polymerase sigma-70 factor (ECF subfamily)
MGHTNPPTTRTSPPAQAALRRGIRGEAVALLRMAQAGDRDAFGQLYASYAHTVRRYVTVRMRDRDHDAVPDLVQDTFCVALQELDRAHDDVEGWLIQLAAKVCTRHTWGRRRYLRAALTTGEHERLRAAGVADPEPNRATRAFIAQALAGLDPLQRLTLQLRFLDGQRHETTARIMGCSMWTVRQRQRRALRQLAARLGDRSATPPHLANAR